MKKKSLTALGIVLTLALTGCGESDSENKDGTTEQTEIASETNEISEDMFTKRDLNSDYDESDSAKILLNGNSAECSSDAVSIDGSTITIHDEGTYIISGTLDDGMIIVNADEQDKPQLVFDGVTINSETSAPLYIVEADKVVVTLAENSENILSNGGTFTAIDENNIDAAIFSKQDLTLNGYGSLTITSPAGHGIVSKDDLVLTGGTYSIDSASHGLDANDSVRVVNASITVDAGKDGIHAENTDDTELGFVYVESGSFHIEAEGDGISAGAYMQIEDGSFDILSGGGSVNAAQQTSESWGGFRGQQMGRGQGMDHQNLAGQSAETTEDDSSTSIKGIKATGNLTINGGIFTLDSADDAIHSNTSVSVNGGSFDISSGDDAFHADDTLSITEGDVNITESYEGLEGLHVEISGGDIKIVSSDDGINAAGGTDESGYGGQRGNDQFGGRGGMGAGGSASSNGSILISGGTIYMNASGDGIDANGSLEISGGTTTVCGPTMGDTAVLDYDTSAVISGGTFIGTGASMMAQSFSKSDQGVIAVSVGSQSAGTTITLTDKDGNIVMTEEPQLDFQIAILSSPDIIKGETYTITVGSASGEFEAN